MLFNSIDFALFLPLVFLLYWTVFSRTLRLQNAFLILTGFVFYGWWDWRFLGLLIFTSGTDYLVALGLERSADERRRKALLGVSLVANLGLLGFFKYYDFFITAFNDAFTVMGLPFGLRTLGLVLPVGISFYTFQSLSYTIDVYRRQLPATKDPVTFFAFVSFFPQMLAGPIERARQMIPQFEGGRTFSDAAARDGLKQMLWGLFKKVVIADSCALYVDKVYDVPEAMSGATLALATILFAFQIYGDFSGYSDIAIGCARLFGFNLMRNFAYPYFSRDMAEFWRRWHISLSTWFRDYLYIPLGGSRGSKLFSVRNSIIVFVVSGFWHGASWNFLIWGFLNGLYFLPLVLTDSNRKHLGPVAEGRWFPDLHELRGMITSFVLACMAWVFFRAHGLDNAIAVYDAIFSTSLFTWPAFVAGADLNVTFVALAVMLTLEWSARQEQHALQLSPRTPGWMRWGIYYGVVALIIAWAPITEASFIYFQF
jgi:alginate O-acetyltransferase complex protein AlgI